MSNYLKLAERLDDDAKCHADAAAEDGSGSVITARIEREAAAALRSAHAEIERLQSDLASTQVALNDWKVFHSTVRLEVEVERLRALLWESENALLDYVDRLEKQGGQMNYGRSVLARINAELGDKHDN